MRVERAALPCDATQAELNQQLRLCFRFGLAATADPQLWWDSFRYVEGPRKGQPITFSEYINLSADGSAHAL